jgi:peptidylprolyl isomerase
MTQAKSGDTVKVHYTGTLDDGTIFDTSANREPLEFTIGDGRIIPGFEKAIIGMSTTESKTIKISCDKAYGPYNNEMVMVVEKRQFPPHITAEVGQHLQIPRADGQTIIVVVANVNESQITLDANHPLAGKDLTFDIQLVEIA